MRKLPAATLRALASLVLQGLASRAIASQLGLSKTTINNLAARIQSGTQEQRQQLAHMPDSVLLEFFYPPIVKAKEEPDWIDIHKKLYRRGVSLSRMRRRSGVRDVVRRSLYRKNRAYVHFLQRGHGAVLGICKRGRGNCLQSPHGLFRRSERSKGQHV